MHDLLNLLDLLPHLNSRELRGYALILIAVGQTLFVCLYLTFPWWKTFLGKALFFKAAALGVLLDLGLAARYFDLPWEDGVFTVLYFLLALGVWGQFLAFMQVRARHNDGNEFPETNGMTDGQINDSVGTRD